MLLTEYDEQAVMQAIAKEAEEKGEKRGIAIGENKGEEKLGSLITAMVHSEEPPTPYELTRVSTDSDYREKMYLKYGIK